MAKNFVVELFHLIDNPAIKLRCRLDTWLTCPVKKLNSWSSLCLQLTHPSNLLNKHGLDFGREFACRKHLASYTMRRKFIKWQIDSPTIEIFIDVSDEVCKLKSGTQFLRSNVSLWTGCAKNWNHLQSNSGGTSRNILH